MTLSWLSVLWGASLGSLLGKCALVEHGPKQLKMRDVLRRRGKRGHGAGGRRHKVAGESNSGHSESGNNVLKSMKIS